MTRQHLLLGAVLAVAASVGLAAAPGQDRPSGQGFSFRTGVAFVSVSATVTDSSGRFVSGLTRDDFEIFENGQPQRISEFEAERVPVSLGLVVDTSGSMVGDKIVAAQAALHRFLFELLGPADEVFLYRFDSRPTLVQPWTKNRADASRALGSLKANGGTAMYDTVVEALPLAQAGQNRKKAMVVISDGNDTNSRTGIPAVQQLIRESEVLVYAIGIDASSGGNYSAPPPTSGPSGPATPTRPAPIPSPFPGARKPPPSPAPPPPSQPSPQSRNRSRSSSSSDRVNPDALRALTDDSGGRTEIIVSARDLDPATAGIADELSKQYFIGYTSSLPKDGKWHSIEVRVRKGGYLVRARKGFIAN